MSTKKMFCSLDFDYAECANRDDNICKNTDDDCTCSYRTVKSDTLEELYTKLAELELKECLCINAGLSDLNKVREEMKPIKTEINKLEGYTIYEV